MRNHKDPRMASLKRQFALTRPCAECPFRNDDKAIKLDPGRKRGLIQGLLTGQTSTFHCHKTVYRSDGRNHDEQGNFHPVDVQHCPGAISVTRKAGGETTAAQLAVRLGVIQVEHYDAADSLTLSPDEL